MFIGLILIGVLIYFLATGDNFSTVVKKNNNAEELLKERFVRGEIDEETYYRMKRVL
ncbi:SHOCT domain-containing protein [Alkalibacter mobilis]|uniref:SHOCT domain-containing protein n=1 Tax=Alkalibacter mobilis TaxID=2787712 RepID=UPI001A9AFFC5|nr:hypothetical protein [Alkalibacter mobilis]